MEEVRGDFETCILKFFMISCLSKCYSEGSSQGGCDTGYELFGGKVMYTEFGWGNLKDGA
jgi:hypothetical protein